MSLLSKTAATLVLAGVFACHPVSFRLDGLHGPEIVFPYAWASEGEDGGDDGGGDDGGGDDGSGDGAGDTGGGDTSGGDDGAGDDGGGDDGAGDDGGGDDGGDDGSGDNGGNDGDSSGDGGVSEGETDSAQSVSRASRGGFRTAGAVAANVAGSQIEVTFQDGSLETLGEGIFTRSAASGEIVERRRATGADMARFRIMLERLGVKRAGLTHKTGETKPTRIKLRGADIKVLYSNGWVEEVRGSRYRLRDSYGRKVAERAAKNSDRVRLHALIPD